MSAGKPRAHLPLPPQRPSRLRAIHSNAGRLLLCLALGALSVLGFAPFYLYPIPVLALAGLAWCWQQAGTGSGAERHPAHPGRAAVLGLAFGLGYFLAGTSWIYVSLHDFGGMSLPLATFATLFFCTYLALFPAAAGWLFVRLPAGRAARLLLVLPFAWSFMEWTRGWMFTGFPWLALGYSQAPASTLAGYAPLIGVYGISVLTAMSAGLLVLLVNGISAWRQGLSTHVPGAWLYPGLALITLWGAGLGLRAMTWTQPFGPPLQVSLLQGNIEQDMKWRPEWVKSSLDTYLDLTRSANGRLILLPETALPLFSKDIPGAYFAALAERARANGGDLLVGVPEYVAEQPPGLYNSVLSYGSNPTQTYRKHHLVPFGDYFPQWFFITWVMNALDIPMSNFSRGAAVQTPLKVAGQRVAVNICYEDVFGEEIIRQLPEATLLANFTNDAWWGDSIASEQHVQIAQMRALESGRYMLRATNTGVTAIIDQHGRILAAAPQFKVAKVEGMAQGFTGSTPFALWGNLPFLLCCLATFLSTWQWRRRKQVTKEKQA